MKSKTSKVSPPTGGDGRGGRVITPAYLRSQSKEVLVQTILKLRNKFDSLHTKYAQLNSDVDALYKVHLKTRKRHGKK